MSIRPRSKFKRTYIKHIGRYAIEKKYINEYGLRNKAEIKKAEYLVEKYLNMAKTYNPEHLIYKNCVSKLVKKGIIENEFENILDLDVISFFSRRLQTVVKNKFNLTILQSRQLIVSGKIKIDDQKYKIPSHILDIDKDEKLILDLDKNDNLGG